MGAETGTCLGRHLLRAPWRRLGVAGAGRRPGAWWGRAGSAEPRRAAGPLACSWPGGRAGAREDQRCRSAPGPEAPGAPRPRRPVPSRAVPRQLLGGPPAGLRERRLRGPGARARQPAAGAPEPSLCAHPCGSLPGALPTQDLGAQPLALPLQRGQTRAPQPWPAFRPSVSVGVRVSRDGYLEKDVLMETRMEQGRYWARRGERSENKR